MIDTVEEGLTTLNVGKNGITESLIQEVRLQLRKKKKVRVKLLKSARAGKDRTELAEELAGSASARIDSVRGNVVLLSRR